VNVDNLQLIPANKGQDTANRQTIISYQQVITTLSFSKNMEKPFILINSKSMAG